MTEPTIRVLIVDDHRMFAQTLRLFLTARPGIEVIGMAETADDGVEQARTLHPDVVLLDHDLPGESGTRSVSRILEAHPQARIVMVSGVTEQQVLLSAVQQGVAGWVSKSESVAEVAGAVEAAYAGEVVLPQAQLTQLLPLLRGERKSGNLTNREREVLEMLAHGRSTQWIAEHLFLSPKTVRNHVQNLLSKLGAHSKLEAVAIAQREGWLSAG